MIALYFIGLIAAACIITLATMALMTFICMTVYAFVKPNIQPLIDMYRDWWNRRTM